MNAPHAVVVLWAKRVVGYTACGTDESLPVRKACVKKKPEIQKTVGGPLSYQSCRKEYLETFTVVFQHVHISFPTHMHSEHF